MSDSSSSTTTSHPFAHLIGAEVHLSEAARGALDIDWDAGIIVCAMNNGDGLTVHIANPENGDVLPAIRLESVQLSKETLELMRGINKMAVNTIKAIGNQFADLGI